MSIFLQSLQRQISSVTTTATATASQTVFTTSNSDNGKITVEVGGVSQNPSAWSLTTSTSITLSEGVNSGTIVDVTVEKIQ